MYKILIGLTALVMFTSCEENQDVVKEPSKDGSVEAVITLQNKNDFSVLETRYNVFVKNQVVKSIVKFDTLPSLGVVKEVAENEDGEQKEVEVPKNYELFITVK